MKKWLSISALVVIVVVAVAAPAAAYSQRTTYPGGSEATWTEVICKGYGSTETDFAQTVKLSDGAYSCDYIQVRANYKSGSWVGYSSWQRGATYKQFVAPGSSTINFGQHGIDPWH